MNRIRTLIVLLVVAMTATVAFASSASGVPTAPAGVTAFAQNGQVSLAWKSVSGASEYRVYRGSTPGSTTTLVSPAGLTANTFADTSAANGTQYYYTVQAVAGGVASPASSAAGATPVLPGCTTGNPTVRENCFPGSTAWKMTKGTTADNDGIEGYATATSIDQGQSVDLKVNTTQGAPYHIDIYRTGWYGGTQARLVGRLSGLSGLAQPTCVKANDTGLLSCANWSTTSTLTTTAAWTSGVYLLKLVREDNGEVNQMLLVVRDDQGSARMVYGVPDSSYQAYNNYGGRSLYPWNSSGNPTVAGDARAVKVSYDRPYSETTLPHRNFYTYTDIETVSWLERQGYSMGYSSSYDLERGLAGLNSRKVYFLGAHDEYWSAGMRTAVEQARDAGVSLFSNGGNNVYWKIRYEDAGRTVVTYKSTATNVADPSGIPTGTWRDPAGANRPENALLGSMYIGDNDSVFFPMKVSRTEGSDPFWRYTDEANQTGDSSTIGRYINGWEWDARVNNGQEPAGVKTLATSPVNGGLLQDAGSVYADGSANINVVKYRAPSGAWVFNAGTNHWGRGLATNMDGDGEPVSDIQQATANMLADMGVKPAKPSGIQLDPAGAPTIESKTPADGSTLVAPGTTVRARFDRVMNAASITTATFTLTPVSGGSAVAASVSYDDVSDSAVLKPNVDLRGGTLYEARLTTGVRDAAGNALASAVTWRFTTDIPNAPKVIDRSPAADSTTAGSGTAVTATFDTSIDGATVTPSSFKLTTPSGATVPATVFYDGATKRARLVPSAPLGLSTRYTATLTTAIRSLDDVPMAAPVSWSFTTRAEFTVSARDPQPFDNAVSIYKTVSATLSRSADPATVTGANVTLLDASAQPVPATVSYDATTNRVLLRPANPLTVLTTYTVRLSAAVAAADGQPLTPASWTFTTSATPPPAPAVSSTSPAASAADVNRDVNVQAVFDRQLDPSTVSGASVQLFAPGGTQLAATVSYDGPTRTVTLAPAALLDRNVTYTAQLTTALRSLDGAPLAQNVSWSFTTIECPCSLMDGLTPVSTGSPVRDNRPFPGPWTYELGTKFTVDRTMDLTGVRYWRDRLETGSHRATVWSAGGTMLAQSDFTGETASGWQRVPLRRPVRLTAGQTYVVSVGMNSTFVSTTSGLLAPIAAGPLHSAADVANGVYGAAAGTFPTSSYRSTNYFVDPEVVDPLPPPPNPAVASTTPTADAIGVAPGAAVTATFDKSLDPSTVTAANFTLRDSSGNSVPGTVSYDAATRIARLVPAAPLTSEMTYTAHVSDSIRGTDGYPLLDPYDWSFTVVGPAPSVTSTSPSTGATAISRDTDVRATFAARLAGASVNGSTFTLTASGSSTPVAATVTYDDATRTVRLAPTGRLARSTTYTARLTTGVRALTGAPLPSDVTWTFTTAECPCQLFSNATTPTSTNLPTRDGRPAPGPWTRELGVKIEVTSPVTLTALRFYKASQETGTHVGRLWSGSGAQLGSVTFANETASGWQTQALASPITLVPGQVYVVSVGFNASYSTTQNGLLSQIVDGPLRSSAVTTNGVYSDAAGQFPTQSYKSSNYFVDPVVQ